MFIVYNRDKGTTGNLNVSITKNGSKDATTVHSKSGGDGFVTSDNQDNLVEAIRKVMEA